MIGSLFAVFIGSGLGGGLRYLVSLLQSHWNLPFQWTTLFVNILGGFIVGVLFYYFSIKTVNPLWKLLLITGFCGGLTTFSSFSLEVVIYLTEQKYGLAIIVGLLHLISSICATLLAYYLMKRYF